MSGNARVGTVVESQDATEVRGCIARGFRFVAEQVSASSDGAEWIELRAWGEVPGR